MRQAPRRRTHPPQPGLIAKQGGHCLHQPNSIQLRLLYHHSGSRSLERLRIHPLMIVRCPRERHKNRGLPRRRNFRHRARARPADDQIRACKCRRHILNKVENLSRVAQPVIGGQRVMVVTLTGLVDEVNPWRLPNTSKVRVPSRGRTPTSKNACRTGTPVTAACRKYLAVSSKCTAAADTNRATTRFANPGTTFGSNANVGMCFTTAASIVGPEAYPPTPITTSGANSFSIRPASQTARGKSHAVRARVIRLTFFSAPTRTSCSGYPAAGTSRFSMPRAVPINHTSAP